MKTQNRARYACCCVVRLDASCEILFRVIVLFLKKLLTK